MSPKIITNPHHHLCKKIRALHTKKTRNDCGEFFIEGVKFVEDALASQIMPTEVVISASFDRNQRYSSLHGLLQHMPALSIVSDELFAKLADTQTPQGVLAVMSKINYDLSVLLSSGNRLLLILDALQDPGNLGTIIRTADAAGFNGIVLSSGCVDIYSPKVLRATMGSIFHIPFCYSDDLVTTMEQLHKHGIATYVSHLAGAKSCYDVDLSNNIALVIGNEATGVRAEISTVAQHRIKIPMLGKSESLNAAVAGAVLMYESLRQRM